MCSFTATSVDNLRMNKESNVGSKETEELIVDGNENDSHIETTPCSESSGIIITSIVKNTSKEKRFVFSYMYNKNLLFLTTFYKCYGAYCFSC